MYTWTSIGIFNILWHYIDQILIFSIKSRRLQTLEMTPLMLWIILQIAIIVIIIVLIRANSKSKFSLWFWLFFEYMYEFFEEILWKVQKKTYKIYVTSLFFVILFSNLLSYSLDLIRVVFKDIEALPKYIVIPTTDFNFNLALAIVSIIIIIYVQFRRAWLLKFFLEYIPITWKNILNIEKWNMKNIFYYPIKVFVKIFDIAISLFVWLLDIIWIWAKVISLTARLYGNMLAGWILLWLLVMWVNSMFHNVFETWFPIIWPIILYAQWLLVALIQAFVFPLLVAIFIKIAQESE